MEERTGLLRAYTSRVEHGHTTPSIATLEKYATALDVPLYTLFYDGRQKTEFDLKLEDKKAKWGATKNQRHQYELFVEAITDMNESGRTAFMYLATKLARPPRGKRKPVLATKGRG